ncbi:MAG TPA: hypothetical protein VM223_02355, partial [Planctomycetota bacterium]|nr:hypothetical protein [Planctomycetota bacterium]
TYSMLPARFHGCLPQTLNDSFILFYANVRGYWRDHIRCGRRTWGHGATVVAAFANKPEATLADLDVPGPSSDIYLMRLFDPLAAKYTCPMPGWQQYESLLAYAIEGRNEPPMLLDLTDVPSATAAGDTVEFTMNVFCDDKQDGTLDASLVFDEKEIAKKTYPIELRGRTLIPVRLGFTVPKTLPDGECTALFTFVSGGRKTDSQMTFTVNSAFTFDLKMPTAYREAGGTLEGAITVHNALKDAFDGCSLVIELQDYRGRVLQQASRDVDIRPGDNGPWPVRVMARDYLIDRYPLVIALRKGADVMQRVTKAIDRCGAYRFQQDLVYVPWGGTSVDTEKNRELMIKSGFNCVCTMNGTQRPGWYAWTVAGPQFDCKPLWPGDLIEQALWGSRDTPIAQAATNDYWTAKSTTVHHWDETEIRFVEDVRVKDLAPQASLCYRKWVKSCYLSMEKLNAAWRDSYKAGFQRDGRAYEQIRDELKLWDCRSNAIPAPRPWDGDLTSWNQIYAYRGAPQDWAFYANAFWTVYDKEARDEYRRYNSGSNPWIWYDTYHTRDYYEMRPGDAEWLAFEYRATTGNEPASIMPHYLYGEKTPEATRRIHWDSIRTGARHFIVYNADTGTGGDAANIWTADYELAPHGKWMADSIARVRSREQVLLDTRTALSNEVAFLFPAGSSWPPAWRTPRAPLTAMTFSGIQPDAIKVGELRGERTPLDSFRVLVFCPSPDMLGELKKQQEQDNAMGFDFDALQGAAGGAKGQAVLPARWVKRLSDWQKKGGVLLSPAGLQFGWEGDGSGSEDFLDYRAKVLARLVQGGVRPAFEIVDDAGKPVDLVEPTVLQTQDRTQSYIIVFPHVNAKAPAEITPLLKFGDGRTQGSPLRGTAPGVREVYSVYGEKLLPRDGDGWRMTLRQSWGEIFSLVTEDLGPVELQPRPIVEAADRRLDIKITVKQKNGELSACRHSLNIRAFDDAGKEIEGIFAKTSALGWRVVTLYPAHDDPPLPWTIKVLDLTSGREAEAKVTQPAGELFASREPLKPIEFRAEPLQPLDADIHLVQFRVSVVNNQDVPLDGSVKLDVPEKYLLDAKQETTVEVPPHASRTITWPAVLGRRQAILMLEPNGPMPGSADPYEQTEIEPGPPRAWLINKNAGTLETRFTDFVIRRWEKEPPLVTNLRFSTVTVGVQNFLDRPVAAMLDLKLHPNWELKAPVQAALQVPPCQDGKPGTAAVAFDARLKMFAGQAPDVYQMPITVKLGDRTFDAGYRLVDNEKRREWCVADPQVNASFEGDDAGPAIPDKPVNPMKPPLWGLNWKPAEQDTLIDFPVGTDRYVWAATNVCFAKGGDVSVRVRGDSVVKVWLAGKPMTTGNADPDANELDLASSIVEKRMRVEGGSWLPLVIRYESRVSAALTDLVFLDAGGSVLWSAEFRADPAAGTQPER